MLPSSVLRFLCIFVSVADAPVINDNGIKTLLAYGLSTFFINSKPIFNSGPQSLPRSPPDCVLLDS